MPVYELIPHNLDDPDWKCSFYRKPAVLRARDERMARMKASTAFCIAVERIGPYSQIPATPWTNGNLVSCQELKGSEYPIEGEEVVLYPVNY